LEASKKLEAIRDSFTKEEYSQAWRELTKDVPERNKNKTLKALETYVRQYIRWAKQESGY